MVRLADHCAGSWLEAGYNVSYIGCVCVCVCVLDQSLTQLLSIIVCRHEDGECVTLAL